MAIFALLGVLGLVVLALSLLFDGIFETVTDAIGFDSGGLLSLPVIATFVSIMGFTGMLVMGATDAGTGAATLVGIAAGLAGGGVAARVTKALVNAPTDATPSSDHLPGLVGTVVTPIPIGGLGEVIVRVAGQPVKFSARSDEAVAAGASVVVITALSSTSVQVRQMPA